MEGIDKARLLSGLLRTRGRYQKARSQTRPFIAYETWKFFDTSRALKKRNNKYEALRNAGLTFGPEGEINARKVYRVKSTVPNNYGNNSVF